MKKLLIALTLFAAIISGCAAQNTWELTSGTLPSADPTPIVFEGEAVLKGWGVQVPYYNGEAEWHFHVSAEFKNALPQDFDFTKYDYNFKLDNDEKVSEFLTKSTPQYKAEIVADKITIPQEGHPLIHFKSYNQGAEE